MSPYKVLLIDDSPDMIAVGEQVFKEPEYEFLGAQNGADGLELLASRMPEITLFDYVLPDMKGDAFINIIQTDPKYESMRNSPFILLTGWELSQEDLSPLYRKGVRAYLKKPFGYHELRSVTDSLIQYEISRADMRSEAAEPKGAGKSVPEVIEAAHDMAHSIVGISRALLASLDAELSRQERTDLNALHNCGLKLLKIFNQ